VDFVEDENLESKGQRGIDIAVLRWMKQFFRTVMPITVKLWCPSMTGMMKHFDTNDMIM